MRQAAVVLNLRSGGLVHDSPAAARQRIEGLLRRRGWAGPVFAGEGEVLRRSLSAACRSPAETIFVIGGDGTVQGMLAGALRYEKILGIVPAGTLNLLARDLDIPQDIDSALACLSRGTVRTIDVGQVNERYFASSSVLGMFPLLAVDRESLRGRPFPVKLTGWLRALSRGWWRYPVIRGEVRTEASRHAFVGRSLCVAPNRFEGEVLQPLKRRSLEGGRLAVYLPPSQGRLATLRLALELAVAPWRPEAWLRLVAEQRMEVVIPQATQTLVMNDGEPHRMRPPLRYRLHPRRLRVLAPAPRSTEEAGPSIDPAP